MSNRDSRNHRFYRGGLHRDCERYHPYHRPSTPPSHHDHLEHHPHQECPPSSTDGSCSRGSPCRPPLKVWMLKRLEKNRCKKLKQKEEFNEKAKKLVGHLVGRMDVPHEPSAQEIILQIRSGKEEIERLQMEEEDAIHEAKIIERILKLLEETNKNRCNILKQKKEFNEKAKKLVGILEGKKDVPHEPSAQEMAIAYSLWKERAERLRREKGAGELKKLKIKIELDQHINSIFDKLTEGGRGILATDGSFSLVCGLEVSSKHSKAKDEGGPTRQFLSTIWKQLTELSVQNRNLFEQEKGYLKVALDSQLNKLENYETVKSYYKAIGKLFAFCALHQYQISEQVLPDPYRYYLFHGWTPMDSCYPLPLLLDSFFKVFCEKNQDEKVEQIIRAGDIEDLVSLVAGWKMTDINEKVREILRVAEEGEQAILIEEKEIRETALEQFKREEYTNLLRQWAMDIYFMEEEPEEGPSKNPKESFVENHQENAVVDLEKATGESADSRIRKVIYDFTIGQRLQNLECIREGMFLGEQKQVTSIDEQGTFIAELRSLFHNMPIGSMERLLFARPVFDTDTVIQSLRACYMGPDKLQATQRLVLERVNDSWRGVLIDSIRRNAEVDSDFLRKFVFFVTGYEYQPSATVLQIRVEFNPVEMNYDSCPVAHTSDPTLKLPGNAYDANEELLTEMLLISINATAGTFGLR